MDIMSICSCEAARFYPYCSCRVELAYFAGKIPKNSLVYKNALTLAYYGSCNGLCPWTSSVPRSSQFSLRYALGKPFADNVRGQIFEHSFAPNAGYCLYILILQCLADQSFFASYQFIIIDSFATEKSRYFAQLRLIIVNC